MMTFRMTFVILGMAIIDILKTSYSRFTTLSRINDRWRAEEVIRS